MFLHDHITKSLHCSKCIHRNLTSFVCNSEHYALSELAENLFLFPSCEIVSLSVFYSRHSFQMSYDTLSALTVVSWL